VCLFYEKPCEKKWEGLRRATKKKIDQRTGDRFIRKKKGAKLYNCLRSGLRVERPLSPFEGHGLGVKEVRRKSQKKLRAKTYLGWQEIEEVDYYKNLITGPLRKGQKAFN